MTTAISSATLTINSAFLREIKEVDQELWELLDQARYGCSRSLDATLGHPELVKLLRRLCEQLALHFSLEESFGYFEEPLYSAPQLSREAERLRSEHATILKRLKSIVSEAERLASLNAWASLACMIPYHFGEFDAQLKRHEAEENELLMACYDSELGAGD